MSYEKRYGPGTNPCGYSRSNVYLGDYEPPIEEVGDQRHLVISYSILIKLLEEPLGANFIKSLTEIQKNIHLLVLLHVVVKITN